MKRFTVCLIILMLISGISFSGTNQLNLINTLNTYNLGYIEQDFLGYQYDSHGCFHFYPRDIFILFKIIPKGSVFFIKDYQTSAPSQYKQLPLLTEKVHRTKDIDYYKSIFNQNNFYVEAYPKNDLWVIFYNNKPLLKVDTLGGPKKNYYLAFGSDENTKITFEKGLAHQTTPGKYYFWGGDKDFYTPHYHETTLLPIGTTISQQYNGSYVYEKKGIKHPLPPAIKKDLENRPQGQDFKYYDIKKDSSGKIKEAKWCSNDFGKYVIYWSRDKISIRSEIGYSTGDLLFEEITFLKDLSYALAKGSIKFNEQDFIKSFTDYDKYVALYNFIYYNKNYDIKNYDVSTYLKMMYGIKVSYKEWKKVSPLIRAAYKKYHFPKHKLEKDELDALKQAGILNNIEKIRGIERELYLYKISCDKIILKFNYIREKTGFYKTLAQMFSREFGNKLSIEERKNIIHKILQKRSLYKDIEIKDLQ